MNASHGGSAAGACRGRAVVIGCGVIGAASAWELVRRGWHVTMLDRGAFGAACSHGNCGLVCPCHVLPLAEPGALREAALAALRRDSPLRVRPGLNPALWRWLWQFALRCRSRVMLRDARALHPLLLSSMRLYQDLVREIDCDWQERGLLYVFQTARACEAFGRTALLLEREFGMAAERWDGAQLAVREPALREGLAGAWFYEHDAHLRPDRLMAAWRAKLASCGVVFLEHAEFEGFSAARAAAAGTARTARTVHAVHTSRGELPADVVLAAAGAWTPQLARQLGTAFPIQPGKGYSLTTERPRLCPQRPLLFSEHRVVCTPFTSGYRLGSMMEFVGYDATLDPRRVRLLSAGAAHYLREPLSAPLIEQWTGLRPMTYDSLPIIGRLPRFENVWVATGHGMLGLTLAPVTGRLVSELMSGEEPHLDPRPYSPDRFR